MCRITQDDGAVFFCCRLAVKDNSALNWLKHYNIAGYATRDQSVENMSDAKTKSILKHAAKK